MSVEANYYMKLVVEETLTLAEDLATNPTIVHKLASEPKGTLSATSSVPASEVWPDTRTLAVGADSWDLTALARTGPLSTIDMTGLRVQLVILQAATTNTEPIVFAPAGANGYNLFGDASGQITLDAGDAEMRLSVDTLPEVAAGVKAVAITSVDQDAIYSVILVAG